MMYCIFVSEDIVDSKESLSMLKKLVKLIKTPICINTLVNPLLELE